MYYYVNSSAQPNGDHDVHKTGCADLSSNAIYLGAYPNCVAAVQRARAIFPRSNGCYWCTRECHTG